MDKFCLSAHLIGGESRTLGMADVFPGLHIPVSSPIPNFVPWHNSTRLVALSRIPLSDPSRYSTEYLVWQDVLPWLSTGIRYSNATQPEYTHSKKGWYQKVFCGRNRLYYNAPLYIAVTNLLLSSSLRWASFLSSIRWVEVNPVIICNLFLKRSVRRSEAELHFPITQSVLCKFH